MWKVFKENVPQPQGPRWVVWDEYGEYLFPTGREALAFVDKELRKRALARVVQRRQDYLKQQ